MFDALIDWGGHARWVPMTRVVIESGDGGAGTVFVACVEVGADGSVVASEVEELHLQPEVEDVRQARADALASASGTGKASLIG